MYLPITSLRQLCSCACLGLFLLLAAGTVPAQVTGVATVQGVVTDNSGAVVAGAEVVVTNLDTGVALRATTNEDGLYRLSGFNPGRYSVEVKATGRVEP